MKHKKEAESKEIERQIKKFLDDGGKIEKCPDLQKRENCTLPAWRGMGLREANFSL